ncbi:hypothetical protein [Nocardioides montaniterrae]
MRASSWAALGLIGALTLVGCTPKDASPPPASPQEPAQATVATPTATGSPSAHPQRTPARGADAAAARRFIRFALQPSASTWTTMHPRDGVRIGLGRPTRTLTPAHASEPDAWKLPAKGAFGRSGLLSALDEIQHAQGGFKVSVGPRHHCAGPLVRAPRAFRGLARISIEPRDRSIDSCLDWFAVDLFLDGHHQLAGVTLDLWEP